MQYSEGNIGRVFVLRMDHGEDLIASLKKFVQEKRIESGMALILGALCDGWAVTGPEVSSIPPVPHIEGFEGAWEVFGMATVYPSGEGPMLHIHSGLGRGSRTIVGCIRERAEVYLIVEVVLFEFSGLKAERIWDEKTGLNLLSLEKRL